MGGATSPTKKKVKPKKIKNMCIAILNKQGKLPQTHLENSWKNNNEGGGLMWVQDGKLQTFKTYEYDKFLDMYYAIRENANVGNIVLHFRIATSGFQNPINLHPFLVNEKLGFVHNGIISGLGTPELSDTYQFNELLQKLPNDFVSNEGIMFFIAEYISSSKLIFLDDTDTYYLVNEKFGNWDSANDNWYSNDSYKSYNDWVYFGNTKIAKNSTQYKKPLSNRQKKRNAKKNRKYVADNFLNATEFNLEWLEDMFGYTIEQDEFVECLETYYEETWEGDLSKLITYISDDLERKRKQQDDFSDDFYTNDFNSKFDGLNYYDNHHYKQYPF